MEGAPGRNGEQPSNHTAPSAPAYSPVGRGGDGRTTVLLADDHPGVRDPQYRARRDELAALAVAWRPGEPVPEPDYRDEEHELWRTVSAALADRYGEHAPMAFRRAAAELDLPHDHVPQLAEVSKRLQPLSGFRYLPVAGLAPLRDFYGSFADGVFWSTQYLRHPSAPLYTPEPDLVHEVIGHANQIAIPSVARLYHMVGRAVGRCETEEALRALSKVFWFTVEFGVVHEGGRPRAFGAGLLSSVGELDAYREADIRPADLPQMASADYDISRFQPALHSFRSLTELEDVLADFLDGWDDDAYARLVRMTRRGKDPVLTANAGRRLGPPAGRRRSRRRATFH